MSVEPGDCLETQFYEDLIRSIAEPEPMCLVLVGFEMVSLQLDPNIVAAEAELRDIASESVRQRLATNLRPYDYLSQVEQNTFAVALKTLADISELEQRLKFLEGELSEAYEFQDARLNVEVTLGYALRQPGETPALLISRADEMMRRRQHAHEAKSKKQ